ncbi:MAG: YcxB family protein [Clostridium sp.]|nr:YcxB family protein [Clostridium sp.]MCM1547514.1 YcxB family protein [Ruminococcus sp.]
MEEEIIIEKRYSIPYDMFGRAFDTFQKKFVYPRCRIIIAVLLIAACINIVNIVTGKGSSANYVLALVCLGLAFINWYNPKKIKKNLMESIKGIEGDVYRIKLLPEKLIVGTVLEPASHEEKPAKEYEEVFGESEPIEEISDSEIYLTRNVIVIEKPDFFMVYLKKAMFYVIPKKDFSEEEITVMQLHFQKQLDKNYRKYEK